MKKVSKYVREVGGYRDRFWYPRIWNGMNISGFLRLFRDNSFRISPSGLFMALINMNTSCMNSLLAGVQNLALGSKVRQTEVTNPPIFIIGHWRSGTTFFHELFLQDSNFVCPDCYSCFCPNHCLSTRWLFPNLLTLPSKRPMDNVAMGWNTPQEDEFALVNMGIPSPYLNLAFPNNEDKYLDYLTLEHLTDHERQQWKAALHTFIQGLTWYSGGKRIVLKSPTHTARVATLLQMYPDAKFVHIHRDPMTLFPSTVNLWTRLSTDNGFQRLNREWEGYVFDSFDRMYEAFWRDTKDIPAEQFYNVSYTDLTTNPVEQMERIYTQLKLGDFEAVRQPLIDFCHRKKGHKKNQYQIDQQLQQAILDHPVWHRYMELYGYLPTENKIIAPFDLENENKEDEIRNRIIPFKDTHPVSSLHADIQNNDDQSESILKFGAVKRA